MLKATSHQRRGRMARIRSSFKSQSLSCEFQDITDEDLQELSQQVRPYRAVSFECNQISARGLRAMKHFCCEQLTLLNLNSNQIGSDGLKILSAFSLVHLKNASFARNRIEERGLMHLAKANWPCLQSLCLSQNDAGTEGLKAVIAGSWKKLQSLNLNNSNISSIWKAVCLLQGNWPALKSIRIRNHLFIDDGRLGTPSNPFQQWMTHKFSSLATVELHQ